MGIDPLYVANEGKLVLAVRGEDVQQALEALREHPLGRDAAVIGEVRADHLGKAYVETRYGSSRLLDMPYAEQLPRIC